MEQEKIIYKELSYKIVGILYDVYNDLGYGYQEKYYERAIVLRLDEEKIKHKRQAHYSVTSKGKKIGRYFMDFIIEDKIVLEIKKGDHYARGNFNQVVGYLKVTGLKLGILANFTSTGVKYKRILNIK